MLVSYSINRSFMTLRDPKICVDAIVRHKLSMCPLFRYFAFLEYDDEIWGRNSLYRQYGMRPPRCSEQEDIPASAIVRSLCATNTLVRCLSSKLELMLRITSASVYVSSADVCI
jgi:hypothetical protein